MTRIGLDRATDILADYGKVETRGGLPFVMFKPTGPDTTGATFAIEATNDYGSFRVSVLNEDGTTNRSFGANVYAPSRWGTGGATVGWPSIGARTPAETALFAKVLTIAASIAREASL